MTNLETKLFAALERMDKMHGLMMKQANHKASWYDGDCIREMNEAPLQAARVMNEARASLETLPARANTGAPDCEKCGGAGWLWGRELNEPSVDTYDDTMTKYSCDGEKCAALNR